jgi:hypothetical protein
MSVPPRPIPDSPKPRARAERRITTWATVAAVLALVTAAVLIVVL